MSDSKSSERTDKSLLIQELKENILTRKDVMEIFQISQVTLWKWMRKGVLRYHNMEKSVFFLKDEILSDLRNNGGSLRKRHRGSQIE